MDNPLIPAVKYATLITTGDGVKTAWDFNFAGGYLSPTHVKAFTENVETGELVIRPLTLIGPNTAQIVPAVANGLRLIVYRDTPKTEPLVDYSTGSILNESSLDKSNKQAVFIAAELADRVVADYDFSNALLYAVETATAAKETANGIDAKAQLALDTSATAMTVAATANTNANAAVALYNALTQYNGAYQVKWRAVGSSLIRSVGDKLEERVTVRDFGAVGDGITDDTDACNAAHAASLRVHYPAGVYRCLGIISMRAGSNVTGDGPGVTTIIREGVNVAGQGVLYVNSGSATAQYKNIRVSDMTLDGAVGTLGFSEHRHLLSLNGVRNAVIERVHFIGFRGDGLYIGYGLSGEVRHNYDIVVRDCLFDGVNKENRNGISAIDVDGLIIDNCKFYNCTRSNMPGAIDMEPNGEGQEVIRRVYVTNCYFKNVGGNVGAVCAIIPAATAPLVGYHVDNCTFESVGVPFTVVQNRATPASAVDSDLSFTNNRVSSFNRPMAISGTRGITIDNNTYLNGLGTGLIGFDAVTDQVRDVRIAGNRFIACSLSVLLQVYAVDHLDVDGNHFDNCGGGTSGSNLITFAGVATSSYVRLINNTLTNSLGKTLIAVAKGPTHTFTTNTNHEFGNNWAGLANAFDCGGDYTPVISGSVGSEGTGTYTTQVGRYYVAGRMCTVNLSVTWTAHTGTGTLRVSLPFTARSRPTATSHGSLRMSNIAYTGNSVTPYALQNTTYAALGQSTTNAVTTDIPMDTAGSLAITLVYEMA